VCEQFADHEAYDQGDQQAAGSGQGEAEERLNRGLARIPGEIAVCKERAATKRKQVRVQL